VWGHYRLSFCYCSRLDGFSQLIVALWGGGGGARQTVRLYKFLNRMCVWFSYFYSLTLSLQTLYLTHNFREEYTSVSSFN
jgi:hypothetical protein